MKSGVASADITPKPGPVLQGHWSTNPSKSVLYPLEVRAAVFEVDATRTALVTVDVIGVTKATTDRVRERVARDHGIPGDHVTVADSHTHCAPASLPCLGMTPPEGWLERIEDAAVSCVSHIDISRQIVHCQALRVAELSFFKTPRPPLVQENALRGEFLDAVVFGICYIDISQIVHCYAHRLIELSIAEAA